VSTILKALKKLEKEKAQQRGGQVNLVQDILFGASTTEVRRRASWPIPLLVILLLVAGGVSGMVLVNWLRPSTALLTREPGVAVTEAGDTALRPVRPDAPEKVSVSLPSPPVQPPADSEPALDAVTKPPPAQPRPAPAPVLPEKADSPDSPDNPERPVLVVSGIVYQSDPASRMAVINDLPVMAGTIVAEARVEEILPDRVVFSYGGERFEVMLGSSD